MQTIKVATSYVNDSVFETFGSAKNITSTYPVDGFKGTRTVAKLQEGRTYNFVTKVVNNLTDYKAVLVVSGNIVTREFNADGSDQTFSITLGSGEDGLYINNSEGVGVVVSYNQEADFDPKPAQLNGTKPFRFWCQTVLPLVYDDSLSYYELLSKVVNYLNSLINDVTNVENIYTNLVNAYTELEAYVNTYFDNLDVSEAINDKLDEMVLHGDFDSLVQDALSRINYTAIINAEVDTQLPTVVDNKLGAEVASQIGDVVASQIDDTVEEQIGGVVGEQIGDVVADQIGDTVEEQIGDTVAGQIGDTVAGQIGDTVEEQLPDVVSGKIGGVVASQLDAVVADQIEDVVDDDITKPVENWLARNFVNPPVDKSLTIENAAADAKVTGDSLRFLRGLTIQGMERKEINLGDDLITYSEAMVLKVGKTLFIDNEIVGHTLTNCAIYPNLVNGATYKITLNADFSEQQGITTLKAGWFMRNVVAPDIETQSRITGTIIAPLEDYIGQYPNGEYYVSVPYSANGIVFNSLNSTLCGLSLESMEFTKSEDVVAPAEIENYQNQSLVPDEILWNKGFDGNGDVDTDEYKCVIKYTLPTIDSDAQNITINVEGASVADSNTIAVVVKDENNIIRTYNFPDGMGGRAPIFNSTITVPSTAKYLWVTTGATPYGCVRKEGYNGYAWKGFEVIDEEPNVPNYDNNFKIVVLYDTPPTNIQTGWLYLVVDTTTSKVTDIYYG